MAKYVNDFDLYNSLFLNNNREMHIKMLLTDIAEPEVDEFYVRDIDYDPIFGPTQILIPATQATYINSGDIITTNQIDIDGFPNALVTGATIPFSGYKNNLLDDTALSGIYFDYGQGASIYISDSAAKSNNITIGFVYKATKPPAGTYVGGPNGTSIGTLFTILNSSVSYPIEIRYVYSGGLWNIYLYAPSGTTGNLSIGVPLDINEKAFIAFTISTDNTSSTLTVYKNGQKISSSPYASSKYTPENNSNTIKINYGYTPYFSNSGLYGPMYFYNRALSDEEILNLFYVKEVSSPVAIWFVREILSSDLKTLLDYSSTGSNSGIITNSFTSWYPNLNFLEDVLQNFYALPVSGISLSNLNTYKSIKDYNILGNFQMGGTYYQSNKYNKLIFSNKEIEGYVVDGSLRVDGNSPIRRTVDFTAIVDKTFGQATDLKLHDFDTKKIKVFIGIKDSQISDYNYSDYFSINGMQKDTSGIVWFKLGTFIPRNVNIKHSPDSFSISVTAQDKMSALDGSFGGVLGAGLEFKDPKTSQNTSFYDTIYDSIDDFTQEPTNKLDISFADDFSIFKYAPATGSYITAGSSLLWVSDATNLYEDMEIVAPGVFKGTKISKITTGTTRSLITMDYPAYQTTGATEGTFISNGAVISGLTFTSPSYKNYFGIQPLVTVNTSQNIYFKKSTINFKNSEYNPSIYTTITNWDSYTWGDASTGLAMPVYESISAGQSVSILGQDPSNTSISGVYGRFITKFDFKTGDVIYTPASVGSFNGLLENYYYKVVVPPNEIDTIYLTTMDSNPSGVTLQSNQSSNNDGNTYTNLEPNSTTGCFTITGTFNALINFEYSVDNGSNWLPLTVFDSTQQSYTTTTSTGNFYCLITNSNSTYNNLYRARISSYVSGSVTITFQQTYVINLLGKNYINNSNLTVLQFDSNDVYRLKGYLDGDNKQRTFIDTAYDFKNNYFITTRKYLWFPGSTTIVKNRFEITIYDGNNNQNSSYNEFYTPDDNSIDAITFSENFFFTADNSRSVIFGSTKSTNINQARQIIAFKEQTAGTNEFVSIGLYHNIGDILFVIRPGLLTALKENTLYYVTGVNYTTGGITLKEAITNQPVVVPSTISVPQSYLYTDLNAWGYRAKNAYGPFTDSVTSMIGCRKDDSLIVSFASSGLTKYKINSDASLSILTKLEVPTKGARSLASDSLGNIYALYGSSIVKYGYLLNKITEISMQDIFGTSITSKQTYPEIVSLSCNSSDSLILNCSGLTVSGTVYNIIFLDSNTFAVLNKISVNDKYSTYNKACLLAGENYYFYTRIENNNPKSMLLDILQTENIKSINAFVEFAPQTDSTIVKDSSETVASILEEIKGQLGSYQYYYNTDGDLVFKEDKRLVFNDPNYSKLNPYDFNFENYNINTNDVPFEYDFSKNNELLVEANNLVDLSAFKNDFFVYGTKKGLDEASDNINTQMLYHIMIDDLSLKNVGATYKHPWQQYIIDKGIEGTTYSNFIYFKELKENFQFYNSRKYGADPSFRYVKGEFLLVTNTLAGVSSVSSFSLYQVINGGTPSTGRYPFKKDGTTIEYLNTDLTTGTGLSVRFVGNVFSEDYKSYQGVYSKICDSTSYTNNSLYTAVQPGTYFTEVSTANGIEYVYQITSIYYYNTSGAKVEVSTPVSICFTDIFNNGDTRPFSINNNYTPITTFERTLLSSNPKVDLGGLSQCTFIIECVGIYNQNSGYKGVFRSGNSGNFALDFDYVVSKNGDPGSWTYYYDIVNIAGNYTTDAVTQKEIPVGITYWAPNKYYEVQDLIYSDNKIYQCIVGGTSSSIAPSGFGDENNLIKDNIVSGNNLTWKINQISIDFNKMKVSAIGSRKSAIFDKDINVLFAPKDALAYFYTQGYYFIVLNDFLGYEQYSERFHQGLESLIRQITILYPNIKLIIVPQSQIDSYFVINKLTRLKDAYSVIKKNFYLNFVNGQSINISSVPIYTLEPLEIIKVADENSDLYGNFLVTDYSIPLSNEGVMSITAVKTHPYNDNLTEVVGYYGKFDSPTAQYDTEDLFR